MERADRDSGKNNYGKHLYTKGDFKSLTSRVKEEINAKTGRVFKHTQKLVDNKISAIKQQYSKIFRQASNESGLSFVESVTYKLQWWKEVFATYVQDIQTMPTLETEIDKDGGKDKLGAEDAGRARSTATSLGKCTGSEQPANQLGCAMKQLSRRFRRSNYPKLENFWQLVGSWFLC